MLPEYVLANRAPAATTHRFREWGRLLTLNRR